MDRSDLTDGEFLDMLEDVGRARRRAEVTELVMAYEWAIRHPAPDRSPGAGTERGTERGVRLGGEGTDEVAEFAPAAFGARLGLSPMAARALIADALDLHHRFPRIWARVTDLTARVSYARSVVRAARELGHHEADIVDERLAPCVDGSVAWTRFETLTKAAIIAADTERAREAEARAAKARFAKRLRGEEHGMASYLIRADVATITAIETSVTAMARRLDTAAGETADERNVSAVLFLLTAREARMASGPAEGETIRFDEVGLLPRPTLHVHTHIEQGGVTRIEGHGPVTDHWVRTHLGPRVRWRIQPVLDPLGLAPVDAYEIPDRHRAAVHLLQPADAFPWAGGTGRKAQLDHTVPYDPGGPPGQTTIGNLAPLNPHHHRLKTHGGWQVRQPWPGIHVWRDSDGGYYLVDPTGTRRLNAA